MNTPDGSGAKDNPFALRWGWLIILAFLVQLVTIPILSDPSALAVKKAIIAVTLLMVLVGIVPNLRWWTFKILAIGFLLNTLAISVNGGLMPVTPENYAKVSGEEAQFLGPGQTPPGSKDVLMAASDTRLRPLTDTLYIPFLRPNVYSIGALVLFAGLISFVLEAATRAINHRKRAGASRFALEVR